MMKSTLFWGLLLGRALPVMPSALRPLAAYESNLVALPILPRTDLEVFQPLEERLPTVHLGTFSLEFSLPSEDVLISASIGAEGEKNAVGEQADVSLTFSVTCLSCYLKGTAVVTTTGVKTDESLLGELGGLFSDPIDTLENALDLDLEVDFTNLGGHFEFDFSIAAAGTYTIPIFKSESELGIQIDDSNKVGLLFNIDAIFSITGSVDFTGGFDLTFPDGASVVFSPLTGKIISMNVGGAQVSSIPVTFNSGSACVTVVIRIKLSAGLGVSFEGYGFDFEAGVYFDPIQYAACLTYQPTLPCEIDYTEKFYQEIAAYAKATGNIDWANWDVGPTAVTTFKTAALPSICLETSKKATTPHSTTVHKATSTTEPLPHYTTTTHTTPHSTAPLPHYTTTTHTAPHSTTSDHSTEIHSSSSSHSTSKSESTSKHTTSTSPRESSTPPQGSGGKAISSVSKSSTFKSETATESSHGSSHSSSHTGSPTNTTSSSTPSTSTSSSTIPTDSQTSPVETESSSPSTLTSPGETDSSSPSTSTSAAVSSSPPDSTPSSTDSNDGSSPTSSGETPSNTDLSTITFWSTSVYTVTSCASPVHICPASLTTEIVLTKEVIIYTTVCPATQTDIPTAPPPAAASTTTTPPDIVVTNPVNLTSCETPIVSMVENITVTEIVGITIAVSTPSIPLTLPASSTPSSQPPAAPIKLVTEPQIPQSSTAASSTSTQVLPVSVSTTALSTNSTSSTSSISSTTTTSSGLAGLIYAVGGFASGAPSSSTLQLKPQTNSTSTSTKSLSTSPIPYIQASDAADTFMLRSCYQVVLWSAVAASTILFLAVSL